MNQKTKKIVHTFATVIPALMVITSGIFKFLGAEHVTDRMELIQMQQYTVVLGLMEIIFAVLYVFPKTMKTGLLLLSCYFGGAIAVDLSYQQSPASAMITLAFVWIGAFIRNKEVFLGGAGKPQPA